MGDEIKMLYGLKNIYEIDKPQIFNKKFLHSQKPLFLIIKNRPLRLNMTILDGVRMLWLMEYFIDFVKFLWPENNVNLVGRVKYGC